MFLRSHGREKDGKDHTYWSLVETVRTPDGPRQRTLCYLGELNSSTQARWLKTIEVFNEQGERQVARVPLNKVRLERTRVGSLLARSGTLETSGTGPLLGTDGG
jgi:hypothetical protein